jgi:hypothetical protein
MNATYNLTALESMTVAQIKVIASQIGAIPDGDKRIKQTWINAVIDHQTKFSPVKVAAMAAHIETVMNCWDESEITPEQEFTTEELESIPPEFTEEFTTEEFTTEEFITDKVGAVAIVMAILVAIAIIVRSTFTVAAATIRACIHLTKMFGKYNPSYDIWYQLQLLIQQRKLSPVPAQ